MAIIGTIFLALTLYPASNFQTSAYAEALRVEQIILEPGSIDIVVRNTTLADITIAQVTINNAVWASLVLPEPTVAPFRQASIQVAYEWLEGEAYDIVIYTGNTPPVTTRIAASATPQMSMDNLLDLALAGLFIGILPIYLGLLWLPALRQAGTRWAAFLVALSVTVFFLRAVEMLANGWRLSDTGPSLFWAGSLALVGAAGGFWPVFVLSQPRTESAGQPFRSMPLANVMALGIGLFSLGEGILMGRTYLADGVSGSIGGLALLGIMLLNVTKGFGLGIPALYQRLGMEKWLVMGFVGGFLTIAGLWMGGFGIPLSLDLFLAGLPAGALLAVIYRLAGLIRHVAAPAMVVGGAATGLIMLWLVRLPIG
jgi:zinc transporter ZupT